MLYINLSKNLKDIANLLQENLQFVSQDDAQVIKGHRLNSPWIEKVMQLNETDLADFDALRNSNLLENDNWKKLILKIQTLGNFPIIEETKKEVVKSPPLGKAKKQHELLAIHQLLGTHLKLNNSKVGADFGGGVGNLSQFLYSNFQLDMSIFEMNPELIKLGKDKNHKGSTPLNFIQHEFNGPLKSNTIAAADFGIGLHTCGNFANDMLESCILNKTPVILNWGCCYSKIKHGQYNISGLQSLDLSQRALSAGTLSFAKTDLKTYKFRLKVMNYKYSFYHWLYKTHNKIQFIPMGNSRASLYNKDFSEFVSIQLAKFYPELKPPNKTELEKFYASSENRELNHYFKAYYAITRYIGELVELYIIYDRANYLVNNGYDVEILRTFDIKISPRNILLLATTRKE
jgi:hypothetical protein